MIKKLLKKYQNMSLTMKASIWFVICGVLKNTIDVLVTPIFTRILTTEQYGYFNVYNSWFQIVKIIFSLCLFSEIFNVGLVKFEQDRDEFISATLGFVTALTGSFLVIYFIFGEKIDEVVGMPRFLVILLFAHVLVYTPYYCWIRRERFDYHYKNVVTVTLLYVILQPLLGILAILLWDGPIDPGYTRILCAVGVQIIIGIVIYFAMMFKGKRFFSKKYWGYSFKTGVELVPFNLSKVVLNQSDRIMINYFSGAGDTGIYSVAHSAAFVLQAVTEALDGAMVPWLYRKLKSRDRTGVKKVLNGLIIMVAVATIGIELVAPEIMKILGSKDYYQGVYCIPALVFSVFLIFIYTLFTDVELFYEKNIFVTISSSVGMVTNIVLNAIYIPRYGFIAAGYTTLFSYAVICLGHFIFLKICLKEQEIRMSEIIDIKFIVLIAALLLGFTLVCRFMYQSVYIRLGIAAVILLLVILLMNKWMGYLKELKAGKDTEAEEK